MKIGDLVYDDYGNAGLVIETGVRAEKSGVMGQFFLVQFSPDAGYDRNVDWHYERDLELVEGE